MIPREEGSVSAQVTIVSVLAFGLVLGVVQLALWQHCAHVVEAVTNEALQAARVEGGSAGAGHTQAQAVLAQVGDGLLTGVSVNVTRGTETATVSVSGTTVQLLPLLKLPVSARAQSAVERFVPVEAG